MSKLHTRPARIAMATLTLGITSSLGMNLQAINLGQTSPGIGAYVSAVFWPVALFAAIELMLHTPWIATRRDALTKWAGLLGVAGMAAWISYWHGVHVLDAYGYDPASAHFGPLAIDGLMAMATLALNRVGQARRAPVATDAPVATWPLPEPTAVRLGGQEATVAMDTESADIWTRLDTEMASGQDAPVSSPPAPLPPRSNVVKRGSVPDEAKELLAVWALTDEAVAPLATDVDDLLAGHFGKSERTTRRWRYAVTGA